MNAAELDALLRASLSDQKLGGAERQALTGWVQQSVHTDQDRGVARSRAFDLARESADEPARRLLTWLEDILKIVVPVQGPPAVEPSAEALFSPGEACVARIVHRFATARRFADVCVFTVTDDRITRALLDAHRRGVAVRVITDNEKAFDLGSDVERIASAGVPLKVDRTPYHMHHKFAVFDGIRLLNGSYNWTRGAAEQNEENLIDSADSKLVAVFARHFQRMWDVLG